MLPTRKDIEECKVLESSNFNRVYQHGIYTHSQTKKFLFSPDITITYLENNKYIRIDSIEVDTTLTEDELNKQYSMLVKTLDLLDSIVVVNCEFSYKGLNVFFSPDINITDTLTVFACGMTGLLSEETETGFRWGKGTELKEITDSLDEMGIKYRYMDVYDKKDKSYVKTYIVDADDDLSILVIYGVVGSPFSVHEEKEFLLEIFTEVIWRLNPELKTEVIPWDNYEATFKWLPEPQKHFIPVSFNHILTKDFYTKFADVRYVKELNLYCEIGYRRLDFSIEHLVITRISKPELENELIELVEDSTFVELNIK